VLEEKSEVVINKPLSMKSHANTKRRTTSRAFQFVFEQEDLHVTHTSKTQEQIDLEMWKDEKSLLVNEPYAIKIKPQISVFRACHSSC